MSLPTTPTIVGSTVAWEGNRNGSWSPTNGATTVIPKSGTNINEFNDLITSLQQAKVAYSYSFDGVTWTVNAQYGGEADSGGDTPEQPIVPTFEIHPKTTQVDLLDSKNPLVLQVYPKLVLDIKEAVRDGKQPNFLAASYRINGYLLNPIDRTNAAYLYFRYVNGLKYHTVYSDTLRKTYTVSTNQSLVDDKANVGRVYSTGTLIASENISTLQPNIVPVLRNSNTIRNTFTFPYSNTQVANGWAIIHQGWLKSGVYINTISATQQQVTVEYEYGDWDEYVNGSML